MSAAGRAQSISVPVAAGVQPDLEAVRRFWNKYPLFAGELCQAPGERAFFEEHERITIHEHSGAIGRIFTHDVTPGREVLDVGCGIGFWVHQFCRVGAKVSACDLSEAAVELTLRRLELFGLRADVRQGNAERLPYADGSFDHVNCQGVIHHTPDPPQCIGEFYRVLKPGGTLCFSVYFKLLILRSAPLFKAVTKLLRPWIRMRGRGRENMLWASSPEELVRLYDGAENPIGKAFTRAELHAMLAGRFRILKERRVGFPRRVLPLPIVTGVHKLLSNMLGLMIVLRCRKVDSDQRRPS